MKAEAQILKGHLDTLLLASLENGPRHGYAVKEALRTGSGARFDLPTGTIYPALRRLEAAGLIKGTWSEAGGRRRRAFGLTPAARRRRAGDPGARAGLRLRSDRDLGAFTMPSALIADYVTGLHQSLPAALADEAATGLIDTYQDHLDSGASDQEAARTALAEFGDLRMVVGEFT